MANSERLDSVVDIASIENEIGRLTKLLVNSQGELVKCTVEAKKFNDAIGRTDSLAKFNKAQADAAIQIERVNKAKGQSAIVEVRLQQATERLTTQIARQEQAQTKNNLKIEESNRAYSKLSKSLDLARNKAKDIGVQFGVNSTQFRAAQKEVLALDTQIKKIDSSLGQSQRNVGNYGSGLQGLLGNVKALVLGYVSFQAAVEGVKASFSTSVQLDAVSTSLRFIFKDTGDVEERLRMLQETAKRLGLEFLPLATSYKSFAGAAVASNFPLKEADRLFQSVANASAKLKLSSEQTEGALNALQQMISKGNVQAEELRGQLGERIPGAFSIAARAMGVTEIQLNKLLKDGEVLAADLLPKLATELDKTFDNNTTEKVDSLQGSIARLKNIFTEAVSEGNVSVFFKQMIDGVTILAETIAKTVTSTGWNEFFARLTSNKDADVIRGINVAFRDAKKEIDAVNKSGAATQAQYTAITIALKNARVQYDIYAKGVKSGQFEVGGNQTLGDYVALIKELEYQQSRLNNTMPKGVEQKKANLEVTKKTKSELAAELRALKDAQKAREEALLSQLELEKLIAEGSAKVSKRLADEEKLTVEQRLENIKIYTAERKRVIEIEKQQADIKSNSEVATLRLEGKLTKDELTKINNERLIAKEIFRQKNNELTYEISQDQLKIIKDGLSKEDKARLESNQRILSGIEINRDTELLALENAFQAREISQEEYEKSRLDIIKRYNQEEINEQIKQIEALIAIQRTRGEDTTDSEAKLAALRIKYSKDATDAQIKDLEKVAQAEQKLKELKREFAEEAANFVTAIVNGSFQNQMDKLNEQDERETAKAEFDRQRIEESVMSEDEKAVALAQIDSREQARKEQLEAKQRQIQIRQARFEKAVDIGRIISNTAVGISAQLKGLPFTAPIIALIGAIGAAQIATVLATPIPAFAEGTENAPKGLAWVGEEGTEAIIDKSGKVSLTPPKATLTNLQGGEQIITNKALIQMIAKPDKMDYAGASQISMDEVIRAVNETGNRTVRALNNLPPSTKITKSGWRVTQNKNNGWTDYINRNIN